MDWTKIMSDAGIPEPPGREDLVQQINQPKPYRVTYRSKQTGLTETNRVMAKNLQEALKISARHGFTFLSILEDR